MAITSFRGQYDFLSNMYPAPLIIKKVRYECAEAAFQAVKLEDATKRSIFSGLDGKQAKALGRKVNLRANWDEIKVGVMRFIIHLKFANPVLRQKLLVTGNEELIEGNTWGDYFWGVCEGRGENMLGRILMEERESIMLEERCPNCPDESIECVNCRRNGGRE